MHKLLHTAEFQLSTLDPVDIKGCHQPTTPVAGRLFNITGAFLLELRHAKTVLVVGIIKSVHDADLNDLLVPSEITLLK